MAQNKDFPSEIPIKQHYIEHNVTHLTLHSRVCLGQEARYTQILGDPA